MSDLESYWKIGVPRDVWTRDVAIIGEFIKRHQLKAIRKEELLARTGVLEAPVVAASVATEAQPGLSPRIGYACMRAPHLHYEGEIYALDHAQWREFADRTLDTLRHRLAEVKTVGFTQLMELAEAINSVV